jgi:phosphatidylinositol dimannoside acyltransferase
MSRNDLLYILLRVGGVIVPRLPVPIAYGLASAVGSLAYVLVPRARCTLQGNLSVVLRKNAGHREVRARALEAFRTDARNWVDTLRIRTITAETLQRITQIEGWHHIETAQASGHGVVIVGIHLGNFDLTGQLIATRGIHMTVPVERMQPPALFELLTEDRRSKGMHLVPLERAPRALVSALRAGRMVGILGDRDLMGTGIPVRFFGKVTRLPSGPASLARRTNSALLLAYSVRHGKRFQGFVHPPLDLVQSGDAERDDQQNTQRLAREMEKAIRQWPGQWLAFTPVWSDDCCERVAATIGAQGEAAV